MVNDIEKFDLVVYHGNCPDGFCAAFVAAQSPATEGAQVVPAIHGAPPPDVKGLNVLVVDFSWDRETVERMHKEAKSLLILDHHKTAEEALRGLPYAEFDMTRSGAQMCWDYFFGPHSRPWYVDYVADRDLWQWKLADSKAVSAFIMSVPHEFYAWVMQIAHSSVENAVREGKAILRQVEHYVEKVANEAQWVDDAFQHPWKIGKVAIVNASYPNCSDVGHELCKRGAEMSILWYERKDGKVSFSLRSIGDVDVSKVAVFYGGGGHKNASGFELPLLEARTVLDAILRRVRP